MSTLQAFNTGIGAGRRQSHRPPISPQKLTVQTAHTTLPHYPFQPLPPPNGNPPFRFDLSQLLQPADVQQIEKSGVMVFHSVGDTGDFRGRQQDFVAQMMTTDANNSPADKKPAFFYHLGDVVYFAGDIDMYGNNFYETYQDYPCFIVAIPGNHDCQPDDPQDGPVDPNKKPLDGWIQNFMSKNPVQLGSLKTNSQRTQMDLPNVYWTFTTPFATILGLFSNVGEEQGEIHPDQIAWFEGELKAADPELALIVAVHHPPFSGDQEHTGSSAVDKVLMQSFQSTKRYPDLVLSGHVHNYQRFTNELKGPNGTLQIPYVVAGAGGYTNLGKLQMIDGNYPNAPLAVGSGLTLVQYDQNNFGFLRLEVSKSQIVGTYYSAPYTVTGAPATKAVDGFTIDLNKNTVRTNSVGGGTRKSRK
jgi:acid phosphatase type 7